LTGLITLIKIKIKKLYKGGEKDKKRISMGLLGITVISLMAWWGYFLWGIVGAIAFPVGWLGFMAFIYWATRTLNSKD